MTPPYMVRFWPKVQKTETCWIWTAFKEGKGYGRFQIASHKSAAAHRVAYEALVGPIPAGMWIDHLCHNRACVNPDHLRPVTPKQNGENRRSTPPANNSSGARGVSWHKRIGKWQANVRHNGVLHHVGYFDSREDAAAAAAAKRRELFTHNDTDRRAA